MVENGYTEYNTPAALQREIWMATGNKYLSVRKFLGMCRPA
jgi:hypothetical protein